MIIDWIEDFLYDHWSKFVFLFYAYVVAIFCYAVFITAERHKEITTEIEEFKTQCEAGEGFFTQTKTHLLCLDPDALMK